MTVLRPYFDQLKVYITRHGKILGYLLALVVAGWVFWSVFRTSQQIDWSSYRFELRYLLLALVPHALGLGLGGIGWALIVQALSDTAPFWHSVRIYLLSNIGRNIPGSIWHVAGRIYLHKQASGVSGAVTAVASGMELVLVSVAGVLVAVVSLLVGASDFFIPRIWLFLILFLGLLLMTPPVFNYLVNKVIHKPEACFKISYRAILKLFLLYVFVLFLGGAILFLVANAVYAVEWRSFATMVAAWGISVAVIGVTFWIPGRVAIRDGVLLLGLSQVLPMSVALVVTLVWHGWIFLSELLWFFLASVVK